MRRGLGLVAGIVLSAGAGQAAETAVFDIALRGIPAATLRLTGEQSGGRYAVAGRLESAGLVAMVRKVRYDAAAQGAVSGRRYTPSRYSEQADTGRRQSSAVMEYRRGVPQLKRYDPPRDAGETVLDPATQGGTVDPLTALFAALRDVPAGEECNLKLAMFDGKRRSQLVLGAPKPAEGGVTCAGEYRRLEGFSAEEMAEKPRFGFTMALTPAEGGLMQVQRVRTETIYGPAVMTRR